MKTAAQLRKYKKSLIIGFLWGFAESLFFFLVPDIVIGFIALFSYSQGLAALAGSIIGGVCGGAFLYLLIHLLLGPESLHLLTFVPAITPLMVVNAGTSVHHWGLLSLFYAPFSGIPYKVYVAQLSLQGYSPFLVLFLTIPSRITRFALVYCASAGTGLILKNNIQKYKIYWGILYFSFWTIYMIHYWSNLPR
jgi:hypothetical protein